MKKMMIAFCAGILLAACGGNAPKPDQPPVAEVPPAAAKPSAPAGHEDAFAQMENGDCATCHRSEGELQGPSYTEIAAKYAGQPDAALQKIAARIITGGTGVWGDKYKMTAHAAITEPQALAMVKYILTFKK